MPRRTAEANDPEAGALVADAPVVDPPVADPPVVDPPVVVAPVVDQLEPYGGAGAPGVVTGTRRGRHFADPHEPEPQPEPAPDPEPQPDPEPDPEPAPAPVPEPEPESRVIIDAVPALPSRPLPEADSADGDEWVDTQTGYLSIPRDLVAQAEPLAQPSLDATAVFEPAEPVHVVRPARFTRAPLTARDAEYACRYRVAVMYGTDGPSLRVRSVQTEAGQATVHLAEPDGSSAYHMTVEQVPGGVRVTRCRQIAG
ncbi:hypothetical protein L1785_17900 [Antribacter sp. KLBMP9083]|uniref:Uncharacterized protein n=1 Tax=Antribacter soli TaxID=2910976 RepID=A0AA41QG57_9MICO|nr:hypothetical protein [Antribacter soli]MCF4122854.1 hypothetical protein [Antribacter soli]